MNNRIIFAADTDTGLTRQNNEDSYVVLKGMEPGSYVVLLADGMGGHQRGELASSLAVRYASDTLSREIRATMTSDAIKETVSRVIEKANVKVYLQSLESEFNQGMGTTMTIGVFADDRLIIAHIGDCRVYRLRGDELISLTHDHTLVQALVDRGEMTPEEARRHPRRNVVTRALGAAEHMMPDTSVHPVHRGDRYLFSTDGLHDYVSEADIKHILKHERTPQAVTEQAILLANSEAGVDNVTVICAFVQS
ncbi:MAG: Stp1/IreP family PP2C-type Ser/Thr phosphatase [Bacillota bacterium]|nr:Stp1/IreP family PP2C-type Ser/Thr phosphatase [Bacillota bacterium]